MKKNALHNLTKTLTFLFFISLSFSISAQVTTLPKAKSEFWKKVQFGGGLGLGVGSGFTNIAVSPSAIYNVNSYFSAGVGLQYSYLKQKGLYSSNQYGASIIGLVNPIEQVQLSVELEQLRVNVDYEGVLSGSQDFWNTGLFLGAGYRAQNVTIGARYNVLFDKDKGVYGDALMPFVRIYF
jgi:long-subunit fatty acid transport protein